MCIYVTKIVCLPHTQAICLLNPNDLFLTKMLKTYFGECKI